MIYKIPIHFGIWKQVNSKKEATKIANKYGVKYSDIVKMEARTK